MIDLPLMRGTYTVTIDKTGFSTWEKQIEILGRIYHYLPFLKEIPGISPVKSLQG
jgi:hypothetical protein